MPKRKVDNKDFTWPVIQIKVTSFSTTFNVRNLRLYTRTCDILAVFFMARQA